MNDMYRHPPGPLFGEPANQKESSMSVLTRREVQQSLDAILTKALERFNATLAAPAPQASPAVREAERQIMAAGNPLPDGTVIPELTLEEAAAFSAVRPTAEQYVSDLRTFRSGRLSFDEFAKCAVFEKLGVRPIAELMGHDGKREFYEALDSAVAKVEGAFATRYGKIGGVLAPSDEQAAALNAAPGEWFGPTRYGPARNGLLP